MKTDNVITDNCEKIRPEYQPATVRFDEGFKGRSYRKNTMSELKAVLEMTIARPDTS